MDDLSKPSMTKAKEYFKKNTLNHRTKTGKLIPYEVCVDNSELGQYGVGL
jgi:hypothetical protein